MKYEQIVVTVIISALILGVQHWGIAQVTRKQFHPLVNYILGVLAMVIPLGFLFWKWGSADELLAMTVVVCGSGAAVASAYGLDLAADFLRSASAERKLRQEAEERERAALSGLRDAVGMDHHAQG
jgi:hypothetical protein